MYPILYFYSILESLKFNGYWNLKMLGGIRSSRFGIYYIGFGQGCLRKLKSYIKVHGFISFHECKEDFEIGLSILMLLELD